MSFEEHQRRVTQEMVAARELVAGAEQVPGSVKTLALAESAYSAPGVKDGLGRYSLVANSLKRAQQHSGDGIDPSTAAPSDSQTPSESAFNAEGYRALLCSGRQFNNRQLYALKQLWKWRHDTACKNEKSLDYIIPDHMMLHIAEVLPREVQGIIACCSPLPKFVNHDLLVIHRFIVAARELQLDKRADEPHLPLPSGHGADVASVDLSRPTPQIQMDHEKISSIAERLRGVPGLKVVKQKDSSETVMFANSIGPEVQNSDGGRAKPTFSHRAVDKRSKDHRKANKEKVERIAAKVSEWTTPYESYKLAQTTKGIKRETA